MYGVKSESDDAICRGCLSTDRKLSTLTNYDLYFALLNNKQTFEDLKYFNILLCWECAGLLRSAEAFQRRLQQAQCLLELAQKKQISTLSTLQFHHKKDYDYSIEESIESKPDIELFIDNCPIIDNCPNVDIKEELDLDQFVNDFSEPELKESEFKISKDITPLFPSRVKKTKHKRKTKYKREKPNLKKIDNCFNFSELDLYFTKVCLSERELEESLERERDDDDAVSRPFKCSVCGFRFVTKTEVLLHRRDDHRKRRKAGKCPLCASDLGTRADLQLHWRRSHPVNRCGCCARVVERDEDRMKHLQQHRFRYRCLKCDAEFKDKLLYSHHEKQMHSKYICDYCGRTSVTRNSLEKHIMNRHLPNKCQVCGQTFASCDRLARHARSVHADGGGAYCVECDRTFVSRAKYARHLSQSARHRPKKKISVPCPECGKIFSRKAYMKNHVKLFHSNDSKHHCAICDKYFVTGFALRSHNKYVHEKIPMPKNKMCQVCGRGFGTNRVLENHMRTHTGERPFACARCGAAFAQRVALRAHLAAIHKEK